MMATMDLRPLFASIPLLLAGAGASASDSLRPFETDGCTAWREGTIANPKQWRHCCVKHDLRFWAGGTSPGRPAADLELRDCVAATGARLEAITMYLGVRAGSYSPRKFAGKQWGNAWSAKRTRTTPLDSGEIDLLEREILDPRYDAILDFESRRSVIDSLRAP
jgi:hypothetical protein